MPREEMPSVFLSHSSKDNHFVRRLASDLAKRRVSVWVDEAQLDVGDSLVQKIAEGIYGCDYVAAVISQNSVGSKWVQKELQLAMTREIEGTRILVLPILIDNCRDQMPFFLRDKIYADFTSESSYSTEFAKLLRAIVRRSQVPDLINVHESSVPVGDLNVGSLLHDQGDDFLAFRLIHGKYRSGMYMFATSVLGIICFLVFFPYGPQIPLRFLLYASAGAGLYSVHTVLSATYLREAYDSDRNLVLELERVGEAFIAFSANWWRQLKIGRHNKKYVRAKHLEAIAHVLGIATLAFGCLALVSLIAYIATR